MLRPVKYLIQLAVLFTMFSLTAQPTTKDVTINLNSRYQQIEGWGSSLCWWAGQVGDWEEEKVDSLIYLITSPDQLNMNIFRFNIGGGDDPAHADGHMVDGKGKRAEMEGYKSSPDAQYDWTADAAQRNILLKIKEARSDAVFEVFSNSPPYWMTKTGCSAGYYESDKDNLDPSNYEAFANYLVEVVKHYKKTYNVNFKTLEPFNESTSDYWGYKGGQEGCHFDAESQVEFLRILYPRLAATNLNTVLAASDETSLGATLKVLETYDDAGDVFDKIGQINTHTYWGNNEERRKVRDRVQKLDKPFWQSETGPSGHAFRGVRDPFENNLLLTQKMFNDLRLMKPQAWLDWQLMEEHNETWCQIRADFETEEFQIIKNFYVRMQVTRFIKQGYTIVKTNDEQVLAAIGPDEKKVVVVLLNKDREMSHEIDLRFKGAGNLKLKEAYRTSNNENCEKIDFEENVLSIPPLSLTTLILDI